MKFYIGVLLVLTLVLIGVIPSKAQKNHFNNSKLVHILKDDRGNILGKVYISDYHDEGPYRTDIFYKLTIVKQDRGKIDTLYFINNTVWRNTKGFDMSAAKENFFGYKIEMMKNDSFSLFIPSRNGIGASDPAIIVWDYKKKIFRVFTEE
ncbi:hypothetical protein BEL04_04855 [Mucilaginibacter sp. PPCGB 2223]|uniref:hypothetical protein n=1 Tax=Mucilaginibacter sp. PPCGB 2223 TaxID=1886027 RepID=UPI00082616FA|nr:hypothetical protein [Mucilaginibacter sp. PPCGB 2223]OCX53627.1 hypothetical protein BEL04_04855 [Mucilaginibacter sp. PPCGB 2223]